VSEGGSGALFGAKRLAARAVGVASRTSGRGGGTTLPGRLLLRLDPRAIARLGSRLDRGVTLISATNGKTTTAGMLATLLGADGRTPVHNRAGSNMTWGIATALLEQRGREGLFEVDEAWLPRVAAELDPSLVVLGNLFRDQLDRYGETEALAGEWARTVGERAGRTRFVLNADDPLIADLGRDEEGGPRDGIVHFGIDDEAQALPELQHAFDAKHCRRCGHPYAYARAFVGHLGHYSCPGCGAPAGRRPTWRPRRSSCTVCAGRPSPCARPAVSCPSSSPSPASTTSTTPSPRSPPAWSWGSPRSGSAPPWERCAAPSAESRQSRWTQSRSRSCWSRIRPGPTRSCAR
jgi:UDP-N-acetylmuramyl tripeptide synthase